MKKNAFLNIFCTILSQIVIIASGLIVPRLLLDTFGSETNGLISSLNQFLNYIALVEGGLGSVVLASLYSPLAKKDNKKLNGVLKASYNFFKKISYIFLIYALLLGVVYPFIINTNFSWIYIFSLTLILSISLFVQYCFSITYKLLLQADQKMYIVQLMQIFTTIFNLIIVYVVIIKFPNIHLLKLLSSLVFIVQPIFYNYYVKKNYNINLNVDPDSKSLSQRWSCFGQNLAYFIHSNTDIAVLSIFTNLKIVSVYSVYLMVISHIKSFYKSFSHAFTPIIGKSIALNDIEKANNYFNLYEFIVINVSSVIFGCCIFLLPSFCMIYTNGITDANYYQPVFSTLLIISELLYILREPYIAVIYSASKFKETSKSSYIEAILNIIISIIFVSKYGLIGVAIGTLIAMLYRLIYLVFYVSKNVINRPKILFFKRLFILVVSISISTLIANKLVTNSYDNILKWVSNGFVCLFIYLLSVIIISFIFDKKTFVSFINILTKRRKEMNLKNE